MIRMALIISNIAIVINPGVKLRCRGISSMIRPTFPSALLYYG
jgi:hypothetical protein